jgi:hypothetical protein
MPAPTDDEVIKFFHSQGDNRLSNPFHPYAFDGPRGELPFRYLHQIGEPLVAFSTLTSSSSTINAICLASTQVGYWNNLQAMMATFFKRQIQGYENNFNVAKNERCG